MQRVSGSSAKHKMGQRQRTCVGARHVLQLAKGLGRGVQDHLTVAEAEGLCKGRSAGVSRRGGGILLVLPWTALAGGSEHAHGLWLALCPLLLSPRRRAARHRRPLGSAQRLHIPTAKALARQRLPPRALQRPRCPHRQQRRRHGAEQRPDPQPGAWRVGASRVKPPNGGARLPDHIGVMGCFSARTGVHCDACGPLLVALVQLCVLLDPPSQHGQRCVCGGEIRGASSA